MLGTVLAWLFIVAVILLIVWYNWIRPHGPKGPKSDPPVRTVDRYQDTSANPTKPPAA